jgi:hypothetical protein
VQWGGEAKEQLWAASAAMPIRTQLPSRSQYVEHTMDHLYPTCDKSKGTSKEGVWLKKVKRIARCRLEWILGPSGAALCSVYHSQRWRAQRVPYFCALPV